MGFTITTAPGDRQVTDTAEQVAGTVLHIAGGVLAAYWALPEADVRHLASFELAAAVAEDLRRDVEVA